MRILPPKIDPRKANDILRALREMAPHYTREWLAKDDDDPGVALLKIFSSITEGVVSRLNRAPDRNFLAFLDMLGIRLLPARPAHAPVKFIVADGTEFPFLVAKRTQVSAPPTEQHPEDLPFETTENLLAIPAKLTSLFAVDPEDDAIYQPPPGFLDLPLAATSLPELTMTAFSAAGSKTLQLDPPEQVKPGDFLRIDQEVSQQSGSEQCLPIEEENESVQSEHLVVSEVKGTVVTVTDLLSRDYAEGTTVRKVTRFELFEARNWQEHILYLGHAEYFAIKEEAAIRLNVRLVTPGSTLQPLNFAWEFYGENEETKEKAWFPLELDGDGTVGLSRNGDVLLTKPAGEVKELEIDGRKNRWLRARLTDPLPATVQPNLPKIESIMLTVSSAGKKLVADNAFHNDNPLTPQLEFLPFGTEPRIFDRFSIASEEAFSKPGAEITLTVEMDTSELLASPGAVVSGTKVLAFARAVTGRLREFVIDPPNPPTRPEDRDKPATTTLAAGAIPAVVQSAAGHIGVIIKGDDGKLYLCFRPATGDSRWLSFPETVGAVEFHPAAIQTGPTWQVYVVAGGRLYKQQLDPAILAATSSTAITSPWTAADSIVNRPQIASTPALVLASGTVVVFITDPNGYTYFFHNDTWNVLTPAGNPINPEHLAATNARPLPRAYTDAGQQFRVFVRNKLNKLVALDTDPTKIKPFPEFASVVDSNPTSASDQSHQRIFVRGKDNHLWSIEEGDASWLDHNSSGDINLDGDPFAISYRSSDFLSIISTSKINALLELRADHRVIVSNKQLEAGPEQIIVLAQSAPSGTHYIHILSGPGAGSDHDAVRKADFLGAASRTFVVLDRPLNQSPTTDTEYELLRRIKQGPITATTNTTLTLKSGHGASVQSGDYVFAGNQLRLIPAAPTTDEITISTAWTTNPTAGDYIILRVATIQKAAFPSNVRMVLDSSVKEDDDFYKHHVLKIISGPGTESKGRQIDYYYNSTNNVVLRAQFATPPTSASRFSITKIPEVWFVHADRNAPDLRPELSWEYFDGKGWARLLVNDDTENFLKQGPITFTVPDDIAKTEVGGQENYWIRSRIVGGDYGRELFKVDQNNQLIIEKDPIRPPKITSLTITYELTELKPPQFVLTFNNLNFLDQTAANNTENKNFPPFISLRNESRGVYFGFDRAFSGAPVKIYFAAKELEVDERNKPKLAWSFAFQNGWKDLISDDGTEGFTRPDYVTLDIGEGFDNAQQFGKALYWLRASLVEGKWNESPLFDGVFINTVEALQARTVRDEILGSSTGIKNQKFAFQQKPVIEGEEVRVREALTDQEREQLVSTLGEDSIRDQQDRILETWVRWNEVPEFFDSTSTSRHYRLDRHTGEIEFGDGIHGRLPPVGGDNIRAFVYQAGGGAVGNVKAGEITTAVTAVAGIDSVINPVAAGGGSDAATNEDMLTIGPAQIGHRNRAVTPEDFEKLAFEASREVRKARCLPNRNSSGRHELGWTTVYIVPDSPEAEPVPSLELRRSVERYLSDRADLTLVDQKHIVVGPPKYVTVSIQVQVFARSLDDVAIADQRVKKELEEFLHPLTGGPESKGWEFGRDLAASDLYSVLESIDEVDHVGPLQLFVGDSEKGEQVSVDRDALIAGGTHKVTTRAANGE